MRNDVLLEIEATIHHWVATMVMVSLGYEEEEWKEGCYRWKPPPGGLRFQFHHVFASEKMWMLTVLLKSPKQTNEHDCGPYTLLALYFLSWKDKKVRCVRDGSSEGQLLLETAWAAADVHELVLNMTDSIRELSEEQQKLRTKEKAIAQPPAQPPAQALAQGFQFPFVSPESKAARAPPAFGRTRE